MPGAHDERHDESSPSRDSPLWKRAELVSGQVEGCSSSQTDFYYQKKATPTRLWLTSPVMNNQRHNCSSFMSQASIQDHDSLLEVVKKAQGTAPPTWLCRRATALFACPALAALPSIVCSSDAFGGVAFMPGQPGALCQCRFSLSEV